MDDLSMEQRQAEQKPAQAKSPPEIVRIVAIKRELHQTLLFVKRPETHHVDCGRVLKGDEIYTASLAANRISLKNGYLNMSCPEIRKRVLPPKPLQRLEFGVAYARIVYESYEFIESELKSSYHRDNQFCYSVDEKADEKFNDRIEMLSKCLPNVVTTTKRFNVNSAGRHMNHAHLECLKLLLKRHRWKYAILLQNDDMMIKSIYEVVSILRELNGANDIALTWCAQERCSHLNQWSAKTLNLYNGAASLKIEPNATLTLAQGIVQAAISREAVHWMLNTVNLTTLVNKLDIDVYGMDEILLSSLHASENFHMPGGFTDACLKRGRRTDSLTRVSVWRSAGKEACKSGYYRHELCIFGIEDFSTLPTFKTLMVNKVRQGFDYSVIECMHELLFNRTYNHLIDQPLDMRYYRNLTFVRYHKNRIKPDPNYKLDCV